MRAIIVAVTSFIRGLSFWSYVLLIPTTIIEGPLIMVATGVLIRLGVYSFWPAYFCLMLGDLIGDIFWYCIGYFWGPGFIKRFGRFFSITENTVHVVGRFFHEWKNTILIVSKITMGFGFALVTLFTAGMVKIPFRRYIILNICGQFIWTALLMSVGFFFTNFYLTFSNIFTRVGLVAAVLIIAALLFGFSKYIRSSLIKRYSDD